MDRASLPFYLHASPIVREELGRDLHKVAVLALQAVLRHRKGLEVALQQISYRKRHIAFSSRIGRYGDLILELDVGDPALADRIFLEQDMRKAEVEAARTRTVSSKRRH
jgi:hypothetical protein